MRRMFGRVAIGVALLAGGGTGFSAETVVEAARQIPVYTNVDVLVVGGSVGGVAASLAVAQTGASVFLAAPLTCLGEDMAGTLRLEADGDPASDPVALTLFTSSTPYAHFMYDLSENPKYPYNYIDPLDKLAEPTPLTSGRDALQFSNSFVKVTCVLDAPERIARIDVLTVETGPDHHPRGVDALWIKDDGTTGQTKDLPGRMSRSFAVQKAKPKGSPSRTKEEFTYSTPVGATIARAEIIVHKPVDGSSIRLSRIRFVKEEEKAGRENPTPLKVKQTLDRVLVDARIPFLTGMLATDLVSDECGRICGVVFANRSGRQAVLAKRIVDATAVGTLGRLQNAGGIGVPGGKLMFRRRVLSADAPVAEGLEVHDAGGRIMVPHMTKASSLWGARGKRLETRFYEGEMVRRADVCTWADFAAAECDIQQKTFVQSYADGADIVTVSGLAAPPVLEGIDYLPWTGCIDSLVRGRACGRAAAEKAKDTLPPSGGLSVRTERTTAAAEGCVAEFLEGIRAYDGRTISTIPSPARKLPVFGEYDVVVLGSGTSGTPAAIAAARSGVRTLAIEYLHVLGGIHTESMICGYYHGNKCGFVKELDARASKFPAAVRVYGRTELFRRMICESGGDVWYGTMGVGAYVQNGKVAGVLVATPFGRGVVLAKAVVDGTGNADVPAAAGAPVTFLDNREFVLMSAGYSAHRLGRSSFNSDVGYLNDSDVWDAWLLGVRARAGAPCAWDFSQLPASRERRRIISRYDLLPEDVVSGVRFPDTIVQPMSVFDPHRYAVSDMIHLSTPDGLSDRSANVPYRSILPRNLSGVAVVGLGFGVERDVLPMVRMQPDLMNLGYAGGLAAALAAKRGGDFCAIDIRELQRRLVEIGNLPRAVLDWKEDKRPATDSELAAAVATCGDEFRGITVVWENKARALPLLRDAYRKAVADKNAKARQTYARILGFLYDATGFDTLFGIVNGNEKTLRLRSKSSLGGHLSDDLMAAEIALGRTHDRRATSALLKRLAKTDDAMNLRPLRGVTLALEELADPAAASALEKKLDESWVGRNAVADPAALPPVGGWGLPPETAVCLREIALARALLACGDHNGKARRILEAYRHDARGFIALHAAKLLATPVFQK